MFINLESANDRATTSSKSAIDVIESRIQNRTRRITKLVPPVDLMNTTLFIAGVDEALTERDIKWVDWWSSCQLSRNFFSSFGDIKTVDVISHSSIAFVTFVLRESAELAADKTYNRCVIKGHQLKVQWSRAKEGALESGIHDRNVVTTMGEC